MNASHATSPFDDLNETLAQSIQDATRTMKSVASDDVQAALAELAVEAVAAQKRAAEAFAAFGLIISDTLAAMRQSVASLAATMESLSATPAPLASGPAEIPAPIPSPASEPAIAEPRESDESEPLSEPEYGNPVGFRREVIFGEEVQIPEPLTPALAGAPADASSTARPSAEPSRNGRRRGRR